MTEIRNAERELREFRLRLLVAAGFVLTLFGLVLARYVWLQVIQHDRFSTDAERNRISVLPIPPNRGLIVDRKGVVLARNYSGYTLEITPAKVKDVEATIDALAEVVEITPRDRRRFKKLREDSKRFESLPIRTRLTDEEVARFVTNRFRFPGVELQARLFRQYPLGETASHVIGYIGRISQKDAERLEQEDLDEAYRGIEHIGKEGLERFYERELVGTPGSEEVEVTAAGRAVRTLARSAGTPGKNLILSVDISLQQRIEGWFGDRRGALVAIEPKTGDVLAFVSKPTFDPNLFVEGIDADTWKELNENIDKPLINRPLTGLYPPGSTYKPFMALAALEGGYRTPEKLYSDPGFYMFGNHMFRDSKPGGWGAVDLVKSIAVSSDVYYYILANDMGVDAIHDFMKPWGFGQLTGIDLQGERRGILPSKDWKQRAFRKPEQKRWIPGETISLGIGQGYNTFTILQLAHATATLANGGVVMKPHLVKAVEDPKTGQRTPTVPKESYRIPVKPENIELVKRGMLAVNESGTGARVFAGAQYNAAGKTGTVQLFTIKQGEKYVASRVAERLRDHSLYIAFAPAEDPKIALAVIVENGGFGAASAAPIARKVFDYYLLGKLPEGEKPDAYMQTVNVDSELFEGRESNPFEQKIPEDNPDRPTELPRTLPPAVPEGVPQPGDKLPAPAPPPTDGKTPPAAPLRQSATAPAPRQRSPRTRRPA
ncbi:penicillin-binding protein 2 [Piscinibacterium candidicorallinum]|jgi:penicillin-binding protein 2|uniref:Peptidoglycan D,D-transpeptidase MrdA n=1 Tax=Piscinibacterium candidicorallinum TaxID=1793872 RepID=A0ABV7H497_9BURK